MNNICPAQKYLHKNKHIWMAKLMSIRLVKRMVNSSHSRHTHSDAPLLAKFEAVSILTELRLLIVIHWLQLQSDECLLYHFSKIYKKEASLFWRGLVIAAVLHWPAVPVVLAGVDVIFGVTQRAELTRLPVVPRTALAVKTPAKEHVVKHGKTTIVNIKQ